MLTSETGSIHQKRILARRRLIFERDISVMWGVKGEIHQLSEREIRKTCFSNLDLGRWKPYLSDTSKVLASSIVNRANDIAFQVNGNQFSANTDRKILIWEGVLIDFLIFRLGRQRMLKLPYRQRSFGIGYPGKSFFRSLGFFTVLIFNPSHGFIVHMVYFFRQILKSSANSSLVVLLC